MGFGEGKQMQKNGTKIDYEFYAIVLGYNPTVCEALLLHPPCRSDVTLRG